MISKRHWTYALLLAFAIHLAAIFYLFDRTGAEPVYRGGGSFDQVGEESPAAAGVFVQLGTSGESSGELPDPAALEEQAPAETTREALAQGFVAGDDEAGSGADQVEPVNIQEPPGQPDPEQIANPPAEEVGPAPEETAVEEEPATEIAAAVPVPKRKPEPPSPLPEMETLGRRFSVQGPDGSGGTVDQAKQVPANAAQEVAESDTGESVDGEDPISNLAFASQEGGVGTASGNTTGEIRELNYQDRVLLWLKRHGGYPYEAAMWRLEGTVTLKFSINRQGEIVSYQLLQESEWHLLNVAVKKMVRRSSPVPPIPPEIAKDEMTFIVPVHFDPDPPA